jgi:UDP-N-acetyl-D-mannosaminuronic acid dehydrogenase
MSTKVCVIGLGYIGLPTAAIISNSGINVLGVDVDINVISTLKKGKPTFYEPELADFLHKGFTNKKLRFSGFPEKSDFFIICVPTPFKGLSKPKPDLSFVKAAFNSIIPFLEKGNTVIIESTCPVGTSDLLTKILVKNKLIEINIAYCPERVLPGNIIKELIYNDRVIGGVSEEATKKTVYLYKKFVKGKIYSTDAKTAEMCKLVENSYRDVNIAFANEISILCSKYDINPFELISLANKHPRVNILNPGIGVGGHCIAVDPWFLIANDEKNSMLLQTSRSVNNKKTNWVIQKILAGISASNLSHPKIACLGLSYKPDVDDLRESPALHIVLKLKSLGFTVLSVEPNIKEDPRLDIFDLMYALKNSDIIIPLVAHKQFLELINNPILSGKILLDFAGILGNKKL